MSEIKFLLYEVPNLRCFVNNKPNNIWAFLLTAHALYGESEKQLPTELKQWLLSSCGNERIRIRQRITNPLRI
jgi:hypothetical protein